MVVVGTVTQLPRSWYSNNISAAWVLYTGKHFDVSVGRIRASIRNHRWLSSAVQPLLGFCFRAQGRLLVDFFDVWWAARHLWAQL
mmetsp:Transcript_11226/g.20270  ORF Transcript_11226/g.20270 Transcript_11226/m.20270 type:complete len:85 (-) Transcript_11226:45-299(-)